jgi:hypothetical protein
MTLLIEDQSFMRESIATILEMEGYALLTAKDVNGGGAPR